MQDKDLDLLTADEINALVGTEMDEPCPICGITTFHVEGNDWCESNLPPKQLMALEIKSLQAEIDRLRVER